MANSFSDALQRSNAVDPGGGLGALGHGAGPTSTQTLALVSAIGLVLAAEFVPTLWDKASGFGTLGVGVAGFIALAWYANFKASKKLS